MKKGVAKHKTDFECSKSKPILHGTFGTRQSNNEYLKVSFLKLNFKSISSPKSDFSKNVLTLLTGSIIGQIIVLAFTPIISRLFSPSDFTTLEQFMMIITIASVIITGKYEFAILHPKDKGDAKNILILAFILSLLGSVLFTICGFLFSIPIGHYYQNEIMGQYFWLLGPSLFGLSLFNISSYWFSREKQFRTFAISKTLNQAGGEPIKWWMGIMNFGSSGLLLATTLGYLFSGIYCAWKFLSHEPEIWKEIEKEKIYQQAKIHKEYPLYSLWGSILNRSAQWAHVGIFTHFYGLMAIGFIALCRRILFVPLNIISNSFSQVFFQKICEIESALELKRVYQKYFRQFLLWSVMITLLLYCLPDNTMGWIFGDPWRESIYYLRILSFWYNLNFVISALSSIALRIKMQRTALLLDVIHFVAIYGAIFFAYTMGFDEKTAVICLVITKVVYFVFNLAVVSWKLNLFVKNNYPESA